MYEHYTNDRKKAGKNNKYFIKKHNHHKNQDGAAISLLPEKAFSQKCVAPGLLCLRMPFHLNTVPRQSCVVHNLPFGHN